MHLDVWIAAPDSDAHAKAVGDELTLRGASVLYVPMAEVPKWNFSWLGGSSATLSQGADSYIVDGSTAVWWRRPDAGTIEIFDPDEQALAHDEIHALIPGVLEAVGVGWVDSPWTLLRARQKAIQLAAATEAGAAVPDFAICGDPEAGAAFAGGRRVIAKAVSTGLGLAPFVAEVPAEVLGRLNGCPTMLQQLVDASADVRLVTVGTDTIAWSRPRSHLTLDWRREDPAGTEFQLLVDDPTDGLAIVVAERLGLAFSVQDWLEGPEGTPTFLEVNPQGQWLFLPEAARVVVPALASLLGGRS